MKTGTLFLILSFLLQSYIAFSQDYKEFFKTGDAYYKTNSFDKAIKSYDKGIDLLKNPRPVHAEIFFKRGFAHMKLGNYKQAIESFGTALLIGENYFDDYKKQQITDWKTTCELAIKNTDIREKLKKTPVNVKITNAGININSKYDDYAPTVNADGSLLIFTSRRNTTTGGGVDLTDGLYFEDFYYAIRLNKQWSKARNMLEPINTDDHESIPCISADGQTVYFYKSLPVSKKNGNSNCGSGDIYMAQLKGKKWTNPQLLSSTVNSPFWESQPSISADGNTLYFVSNRPGGLGGKDIYISIKDKKTGTWLPAKNTGAPLNTQYDEAAPFIHLDNKTLYFSSIGHPGMGGYDIFVSKPDVQGNWTVPENIGYPINSEGDDVFFRMIASGEYAYTSSLREGGMGGIDIYEIQFPDEEKKETNKPGCVVLIKGKITDAKTGSPLESPIAFENLDTKEEISEFNSNSETGNYMLVVTAGITYGIVIEKEGYLFHSENVFVPEADCKYREIIKDIALKKMETGQTIILNNIFFDFDKATLLPQSILELNRMAQLMKINPGMKIEISGHTDNKGTYDYNLRLSQERSESVVTHLVNNGIDKSRLMAKGYADTKPIAPNINPDGSDNPDGRQQNRRTEFKILSR